MLTSRALCLLHIGTMGHKIRITCAALCVLAYPAASLAAVETLEQAWADAYSMNPSLQAERAELRATDEQVSQALSHWRPSIDATANGGRTWQRIPGLDLFGDGHFADETHGVGAQLTQPVFRGFQTIEQTEAAEKQVLAGRAKLQHAEQQLFTDTATAFLDLIRDLEILNDERDNEHVLQQKLQETRVRNEHGDLTQTDVRQAEARLARAGVSRVQAENAVNQDRASFQRLVGHLPETLSVDGFAIAIPKTLNETTQQAAHSPDVAEAQFNVEEARAEIKLNEGPLLPQVDLVASSNRDWGQSSTVPGREDSSQVLLQATIPLYHSGADYSRARAAEQTLTQRQMELEDTQHKAVEAATNAWQSFENSAAALEADETEVAADAEAFKGVKVENQVGTRTTLDVLNAEQELVDAKISRARSLHDKQFAMVQIKSAIGELTADKLKLPVKAYDPSSHYHDVKYQLFGFSKDNSNYQAPTLK